MSDITVKQALEGFIIEDMHDQVEVIEDAIDILANFNVEEHEFDTITRVETHDNASFESPDNYGVVPEAAVANYADRQIRKQVLTLPRYILKRFIIPESEFLKYKINYDMLEATGEDAIQVAVGAYNSLSREIKKLIGDAIQEVRDDVHTALSELGSSSDTFCLPFNEQIIADSRSNGIWNFDNKGTAALSETELGVAHNSYGFAVDIKGRETGKHTGKMLLVASDTTTAEQLFNPDLVKDVTLRSIVDGGDKSIPKMVGKYSAGPGETNDWILISDYVFKKRTIRRIISPQYRSVSAGGVELRGWLIDIFADRVNNRIVIEIKGRSKFAIESPVGFFKAIV